MHKSGPLCASQFITLQKDGHAPEAGQRWAGSDQENQPRAQLCFLLKALAGSRLTEWEKQLSFTKRSLLVLSVPTESTGDTQGARPWIVPVPTLLLHYKWAHVPTPGAIFTICDYKPENRGQVCLARHCAHPVSRIVAAPLQDLNR